MTPEALLSAAVTIYTTMPCKPQVAVERARELAALIEPDADWLRPLERALGLAASGCDESGGA